jgi:hypothetical protein
MARAGQPARRKGPGYKRPLDYCDVPGCDRLAYRLFRDEENRVRRACVGHFRRIQRDGDPRPDVPLRRWRRRA